MSYYGRKDAAREDCLAADIQIDGNDPSNTSPVLKGSSTAGMAPMSGENKFSHSRTRPNWKARGEVRRTFPTEGVGPVK